MTMAFLILNQMDDYRRTEEREKRKFVTRKKGRGGGE